MEEQEPKKRGRKPKDKNEVAKPKKEKTVKAKKVETPPEQSLFDRIKKLFGF